MNMAPQSNRFAASRLQVGNGLPAPVGQPRPGLHLADGGYGVLVAGNGLEALAAVTVSQIYLGHYSENRFYRTI